MNNGYLLCKINVSNHVSADSSMRQHDFGQDEKKTTRHENRTRIGGHAEGKTITKSNGSNRDTVMSVCRNLNLFICVLKRAMTKQILGKYGTQKS